MSFGNILKKLRQGYDLTQEDLAKKINTSRSNIANYENDKNMPSIDVLNKLSEIFNCSIDYLLGKSNVRNTSTIDFSKDELHIALSAEDKGYISEDVKKAIENYAKFVIDEEEKEAIDKLKSFINIPDYVFLKEYEQLIQSTRIVINLIEKLQKENEEKTILLFAGAEKVRRLEKENEELKGTLRDTQNSWFEDTKKIEKLKKENQCYINSIQSIVPVLTQDYIEKQKIKEVIKELEDNICRIKKQYSNGGENCNTAYLENLAQVKILKQILKESEEK